MKVQNVGTIKELTLPEGWQERASSTSLGVRWEKIFSPTTNIAVELGISYRGVPLDEASRKVLSFMLKQGARSSIPVEEMMALRTVMGIATTGDNQYTNTNPLHSIDGPIFDLQHLSIVEVNGKMVLRIEGKFKNGRCFKGITYQAGSEGRIVEELFLQAPEDHFKNFESEFENVLKSIAWR